MILLQSADRIKIVPGGDFIYTMPSGVLFKDGNTVPTDITAINNPVKCVISDNDTSFLNEMEVVGTNRIVYTGARERAFTVNVTVSASLAPAGGNNRLCNFIIYRNGSPLTTARTSVNLRENLQVVSSTISVPIRMHTDDYLEVWVENTENKANIIVRMLSVVAIALSCYFPEDIPPVESTMAF